MEVITRIQTICPQCHRLIEGRYMARGEEVYLEKTCPIHGDFSTFIAPSLSEYLEWTSTPTINIAPKAPALIGANEAEEGSQCPLHCGLCHNHLQTPCCVLIEITQRCNQHCPYCFASSQDNENDPTENFLTLDVISKKLDYLLELGEDRPFNIQFSGGEPTLRDDLPDILALARSKGFPYLQVNTNGKRLAEESGYAERLKSAGASVIFLQFDGSNDKVYQELRNEDLWETKQKAIEACREAKLPVTLVPTLAKNINMDQISSMLEFLWANLDIVAGIHFQPVSFFGRFPGDLKAQSEKNKVTLFELLREIELASGGRIKTKDLVPMNTGHTLCGFHGTFLREDDGSISLLKEPEAVEDNDGSDSFDNLDGIGGSGGFDSFRSFDELCDKKEANELRRYGCEEDTQRTAKKQPCSCSEDPLQTIIKDRGFVLNKWGGKGQGQNHSATSRERDTCEKMPAGDPAGIQKNQKQLSMAGTPMDLDEFLGYMRSRMFTISAMAFQDLMSLDGERLKRCRVHVLAQDNRIIPFCSYNTLYREEDLEKVRCLR